MKENAELAEARLVFTQPADSVKGDDYQTLTVSLEDAGGGLFFVIETERWSFDNIEDFVKLLGTVKRLMNK